MICVRPINVCTRNLQQQVERGKITSSESTTRFPQAACFKKPTHSVPEIWGHMYNVLPCSTKGMRNGTRNRIPLQPRKARRIKWVAILQKYLNKKVATKIRKTCEKTYFTPSSPIKLMGPRGASLAIFVSLAGAPRSVVAVGFDDAWQGQYYWFLRQFYTFSLFWISQ